MCPSPESLHTNHAERHELHDRTAPVIGQLATESVIRVPGSRDNPWVTAGNIQKALNIASGTAHGLFDSLHVLVLPGNTHKVTNEYLEAFKASSSLRHHNWSVNDAADHFAGTDRARKLIGQAEAALGDKAYNLAHTENIADPGYLKVTDLMNLFSISQDTVTRWRNSGLLTKEDGVRRSSQPGRALIIPLGALKNVAEWHRPQGNSKVS